MKRSSHTFGFLLALVGVATALSPASAGPLPQRGGQRGRNTTLEEAMRVPQEATPQLFGATVARVRVDAVVTGSDGDFVADLTAADFALYEDGERQEIVDVQLVDLAAGEVHPLFGRNDSVTVSAGDASPGAETDTSGAVAEAASAAAEDAGAESADTSSRASELGAVIFLIDGPGLSVETRARFGDAWQTLLEQTGNLRVPRAAYMVDNTGQLRELAPLGHDLEAIRGAADSVREASFFGDRTRLRLIELANDLNDATIDPEVRQRLAAAKARSYEGQERSRSLATYELLTSFADALWSRSGRTAVVWVSTGIKLMQGGPFSTLVGDRFDSFSPDATIYAAQEELTRAANGSNVSFYTVDPSLLVGSRFVGSDVEMRTALGATMLSTPEMQQSLDGLRDAMRTAAADTGGRSFIHATDLRMVLEEIEQDTSRFYLITYEPPGPHGDGEYHEIRVEVDREGVDVRSRGGYVDHAPADRAKRLIAAALALPGSVTDLPVHAEVVTSRPAAGSPNALMAVAVEGADVGLMVTPDGGRGVSLDIHAVAVQGDRVIDASHEQLTASSGPSSTAPSDPVGALVPTLVGYFAYQHEWALPPGEYKVNVAVLDNVTGRVGAASVDVEIAAPQSGWGVSDPLLVSVDAAGRIQPVVRGRVVPGQSVAAFAEVYGGQQPILSGQVLAADDPGTDETHGARLFPLALRRVAVDIHRGSLPLPTGMPPGEYVVQLVITDPPAGEHSVVRLPLEVVAPPGR